MVRSRLQKGRKVLVENPWPSELWNTLCMNKLIAEAPTDAESGECLELVRGDQCAFGLQDRHSGLPHLKPTGFLTASKGVKEQVQRRCAGDHEHQPLEGGQRTKNAQEWPKKLCQAILRGFLEDLHSRTVLAAFHESALEELDQGEPELLGSLDYIYDEQDVSKDPILPQQVNDQELQRQEGLEEMPAPPGLLELEVERKHKWLRIPRSTRVAIRRLRNMIGHGSNSAMLQLLRTAGASSDACEAVRHFSCETCKKREPVKQPPAVKMPSKMVFNHEIAADCFEIHDSCGNRHTVLSVICMGTLYHQAWWVAGGGVPKSSICAETLLQGWFQPYGAPIVFTCDRGVHNRGRVQDLLRIHGVQLRYVGLEAPFQLGRAERQGSILKDILKGSIEERQIRGVTEMKMLIAEAVMVKNCRVNHHGFTPAQWVLGRLPADSTSITAEEAASYRLGVHEEVMEPEDQFSRQLEIRQAAKMSYAKVDSSRRIRAALLRKSVPLRGPYAPGDLVCFHRKNRWHGPARIVGKEGRATFWIIHAGIPIVVAESQIRPATTSEVMVKQILELRPSRKRKREIIDDDAENPFADDLALPPANPDDEQQSYLEVPQEPGVGNNDMDFADAGAPPGLDLPGLAHPPGLDLDLDAGGDANIQAATQQGSNTDEQQTQQPESEQAPSTSPTVPPTPSQANIPQMTLNDALHRSADRLDGLPRGVPNQTAHSHGRERSRSPHREAAHVPVPMDDAGLYAQRKQQQFDAFLAKRMPKKKRQVGAGRELTYNKCDDKVEEALDKTRMKEWSNWQQFEAATVLPPGPEQDQFLSDNPDMTIIPSRWVDADKSDDPTKPEYKSRLVARGDLENNDKVRTDSPTTSQLFLHLIISLAVSNSWTLMGGDISAAFLQGAKILRKLGLKVPADGIPGVPRGSILICSKSVYGTTDAPRGFWKGLFNTLTECGLKPVPNETSAYYLPGPEGEVRGLLGTHVDDLLWCGDDGMAEVMAKVQERYKFRITSASEEGQDSFKFCGRILQQTPEGVTVTCPSVLDRVKGIYVEVGRRKQRSLPATPSEVSQLRSIVGSLSWYSRVCRPDLSFQVNQLQAVQQRARVEDLLVANRLLSYAMETKDRGVHFPAGAFDFKDAVVLSINDASHAASWEATDAGNVVGHRSQSGRLLALAHSDFLQSGTGKVHLLQWNSTVIKRVCRSTMQAETMSLQLGSEDAEHVRQLLYVVKNKATAIRNTDNFVAAMDDIMVGWFTDCRSLSDHLSTPGASEVADKRLAIDLTSLRQELWRERGQLVGNATYSDELPPERTTLCKWVSTRTMAADALTKGMKSPQLDELMHHGTLTMEYQHHVQKENYGCESDHQLAWTWVDMCMFFRICHVTVAQDLRVASKSNSLRPLPVSDISSLFFWNFAMF